MYIDYFLFANCLPPPTHKQGAFYFRLGSKKLKGRVSRDGYFFYFLEGLNIFLISTLCVCADSLQGLSKAFHYLIELLTFFASLKLFINFENAYWNPSQNTLLCDWPMTSIECRPIYHWLQGKYSRINLSQAASGLILQNCRRLPVSIFIVKIANLGSLKRVTVSIFKISTVSNFKWSSYNFEFDFFSST